MLIARAPFRISLAGGGTDLPAYYERFGGLVVSTTINRYVYVVATSLRPDQASEITSADYQTFYRHHSPGPVTWNGELALPRAVLHELDAGRGISLLIASEVPPGTGLGSSSAVAVALIAAVSASLGRSVDRHEIARLACVVELEKLGAPIGKQDQYAAALGGLNLLTFTADNVQSERLGPPADVLDRLDRRLMLFFTGTARDSASILREQRQASEQPSSSTLRGLHRIKAAAETCRRYLEAGDLDAVGALLDETWQEKRQLASGITNSTIDEVYELARRHGALGGKITGAGGGGFLLLYCHEEYQDDLTTTMEQRGLRRMDFMFDQHGACIASVSWSPGAR
jgi:D-glycero-alpha-D-manno-heptose-7-phosphate kinase